MAKKKKTEDGSKKVERLPGGSGPRCWSSPLWTPWSGTTCPYAMSVIISQAIRRSTASSPATASCSTPCTRCACWGGNRTKSANIVGQTMRLNPHGDAAIYDTMVRLSRGYGALLNPYVDSKGNFGKVYSRDMAWAASRYTEARLDPICAEFFRDIDKDTVDFVDNYDGTMKEPSLLPTTFPQRAGVRQPGHRRGHGFQHLRLQPGGGVRHRHRPDQESPRRPDGHPEGPGFLHRRYAALRPEGAGEDLRHRPGLLQSALPLAL